MKKRILALILTFVMVLSLVPASAFAADTDTHDHVHTEAVGEGTKAASNGATVLAFTSDVHNGGKVSGDNTAATRLNTWIDNVKAKYGTIDAISFGGDMGSANFTGQTFWDNTANVMTVVETENIPGVYTTGNHEYSPGGNYNSMSNETTAKYKIDAIGEESDDYVIYCLGSTSGTQQYTYGSTTAQVEKLTSFLADEDGSRVIFIITHFPLHYISGREISNADRIIDALNTAAGAGKTIVFLWGHNHTSVGSGETHYDKIYGPSSELQYASSSSSKKTIQFYYGAAGCMSDEEYSTGSKNVNGKGLVVTITPNRGNTTLGFTYYNENGTDVTDNASVKSADISLRSVSTFVQTDTLEAGNEYLIATANEGSAYILSNEDGSVSDSLKGYSVTVSDGKITLGDGVDIPESNVVFSSVLDPEGLDEHSIWLEIDDQCLYMASRTALSMADPVSGKYWHYKGEERNLLWFFQDSNDTTTYGYNYTGSIYRYYLNYSDGNFTKGTHDNTTTTIANNTDTPPIYLFVKSNGVTVPVTGVTLDKETDTVEVGKTTKLTATVSPDDASNKRVTWESSNENVATVSNGTVTGIGTGTATITVKTVDGEFTDTCTITVTPSTTPKYVLVDSIKDGGDYLIVSANAVGNAFVLKNPGITSGNYVGLQSTSAATGVSIQSGTPVFIETDETSIVWHATANSGGTGFYLSNNNNYLRYASNNLRAYSSNTTSEYWTYTASNNHLTYSNGSRNLRYSTSSGYFQTSSSDYKVYLFEKLNIVAVTGVVLDKSSADVALNGALQLTATIAPTDATNKNITWSSSDETVATVDTTGKVTGVAEGTATITVTTVDGGFTASCVVTVSSIHVESVSINPSTASVAVNGTVQLTAVFTPESVSNANVSWSTGDSEIATVDNTGKVTGVAVGETTITVTTEDGNKTATCTVTVTKQKTYVIVIDNYALSTDTTTDQVSNSNGAYIYTGLAGVAYTSGDAPADNIRWIIEETTGGYFIKSLDGRYLNATYTSVSNPSASNPTRGVLKLDNTPDVWMLDSGVTLENWEVNGSKLKSTNADKSMTHEESSSSSGGTAINLFTVRSTGETSQIVEVTDYTICYDANAADATGEVPDQTGGAIYTVSSNGFTREGYVFQKWNTKADGTGDNYNPGDSITLTEDITLYAQWVEICTTHTYGDPIWTWTGNDQNGFTAATATFTCSVCGTVVTLTDNTIDVQTATGDCQTPVGATTYTATVTLYGTDYSDVKSVGGNATVKASNTETNGEYVMAYYDGTKYYVIQQTGTSTPTVTTLTELTTETVTANMLWVATAADSFKLTNKSTGRYIYSQSGSLISNTTAPSYNFHLNDNGSLVYTGRNSDYYYSIDSNGEFQGLTEDPGSGNICLYQIGAVQFGPHNWEFQNFTWTGTTAVANYKCSVCNSTNTVNAAVEKTSTTAATCEDPAYDVYTATISETNALDGQSRTENKSIVAQVPGGSETVYVLASSLEAGGRYLIVGSGTAGATSNSLKQTDGTKGLQEVHILAGTTLTNNTVYIAATDTVAASIWDAVNENGYLKLKNNGYYMQVTGSGPDLAFLETETYPDIATWSFSSNVLKYHYNGQTGERDKYLRYTSNDFSGYSNSSATIYIYKEQSISSTTPSTALGHDWDYENIVWNWDGFTCETATLTCTRDSSHTMDVPVTVTSETVGNITTYTASFTEGGTTYSDTKEETLHTHTYGEPTYVWAADNTTCTATMVCSGCDENTEGHTVTETVTATSVVTAPTCVAAGFTTYTAVFTNEAFEDQETVVQGAAATGHTYGQPTYVWSDDHSTCTATMICSVCADGTDGHIVTENATVTSEVTAPTCVTAGFTTYTAVFTNEAFATQTETVEGQAAIGHNWAVTWAWADDYSSATASFVCQNNSEHTDSLTDSQIDYVVNNDGSTTYTASVTLGEETFNDSKTVEASYYLVGTMSNWTIDNAYKFELNSEASGEEYILSTTLTQGHELKVVRASNNVSSTWTWYPDPGNNYTVDADHAGAVMVYFSPTYKADWSYFGGHIYISKAHAVTVTVPDGNGTAAAAPTTASKETTITLTLEPETGYELDSVVFTKTNGGDAVTIEYNAADSTFAMPDYDVTVTVSYKLKTFTITWLNADGTAIETDENVPYGTVPTFDGTEPTKAADDDYHYTFSWDKTVVAATEDTEYTATFTAVAHTWNDGVIDPAPTCTEAGVKTFTCTVCGHTKTETVAALGHDWGDWTVSAAATCTTVGSQTRECSRCHETETAEIDIDPNAHDWADPTYEWAEGNASVTATRVCSHNASHIETETVTATGEVTTPATCEGTGVKTWTSAAFTNEAFSVQTTTEDIPAAGHEWAFVDFTWTETDDGYTAVANFKCTNDESHTKTENATVTSETNAAGITTYTATLVIGEQTYTDTKVVYPGHHHDDVDFTAWTSTTSLPTVPGSYYLTEDVTLSEAWTVPAGEVDLCLNGYTITLGTRSVYIKVDNGSTLSLYDCADIAGNITGTSLIAAVYVYEGGIFNMHGGSISGLPVLAVANNGTFRMTGGSITNNAIGVACIGTMYVSGSPVISNNVSSGDTTNVLLYPHEEGPAKTIIVEGALTEDALIGVTLNHGEFTLTCAAPYVFTSGLEGKGSASNFTSDEGFSIRLNDNGEAEAYIPHTWSQASYEWTIDNTKVTASHTCSACGTVETETVDTVSEVTLQPTCVGFGQTTYTATFTKEGFETQTETVVDIPPAGHSYGTPSYEWNGFDCTATAVCTKCDDTTYGHTFTETAHGIYKSQVAPTCTEAGSVTVEASFVSNLFTAQTTTIQGKNAVEDTRTTKVYVLTDHFEPGYNYLIVGEYENGGYGALQVATSTSVKSRPVEIQFGNVNGYPDNFIETPADDLVWTVGGTDDALKISNGTLYLTQDENHLTLSTSDTTDWIYDYVNGRIYTHDGNYAYFIENGTSFGFLSEDPASVYVFAEVEDDATVTTYTYVDAPAAHTLTEHQAVSATCTEPGNSAYWSCSACGKFFSDAEGTTEITENSWVIAALGHNYGAPEWTWTGNDTDGYTAAVATFTCSRCGDVQTPEVTFTVTDGEGNDIGKNIYTASITFEDVPYSAVKKVTKRFTVTFDMQGHGEQAAPQVIAYGGTITKPVPSADGWIFGGWYKEPECQNRWYDYDEVTQDITLYAKWTGRPTAEVNITVNEKLYNGAGQRPGLTVTFTNGAGTTYDIGRYDYAVYYYSSPDYTEESYLGIDPDNAEMNVPNQYLPIYAGTYYLKIVVPESENGNYNYYGTTVYGTFTITKRSLVITSNDGEGTYNGSYQGAPGYTLGGDGLADSDEIWSIGSSSPGRDAGTYNASFHMGAKVYNIDRSAYSTDSYTITYQAGTYVIHPAPLTITAVAKSYTYNGAAQGPAGTYTSNLSTYVTVSADGLKGGDTLKSIKIAGSRTDAGEYENEIVPSDAAFNYGHTLEVENPQNYDITYVNATLTITQATANTATVTLEGWTYGEQPNQPATTATFGADTATYTYSATEDGEYTATVPTAPGTYYVKATIAETGNYVGATATASFTIAKTEQSAPTGLGKTDETIIGKNDGTITGLTEGMEYSADGETWTAITEEMLTDGALTGLAPGTYQVRYAETDTASASETVELVIAASTVAREYDDEWTWTETETGYTATVVLTAKDDPTVVLEPEDVVVTSVTTEPTATDPGKIVYTATVTVNGVEYTSEKVVVLPATGVTVSGTVISFLGSDESDEAKVVTLTLTIGNAEEPAYTTTVNTTNGTYTFLGVAAGTYTLAVSKMYHVTRTYQAVVAADGTVTITEGGEAVTQLKIHLRGDVTGDGKVTNADVMRINVYIEEVGELTDYELACADVNDSNSVSQADVMIINRHIEEEAFLW